MSDVQEIAALEYDLGLALAAARKAERQRDQLREGIEAHRAEKKKIPPPNMVLVDFCLYELADQIKGGDASAESLREGSGTSTHATRGGSDQVDGVAPEQTLHGLATWLVAMDEPGSSARQTVTLNAIIEVAREALANSGPDSRLQELLEWLKGERETDDAAEAEYRERARREPHRAPAHRLNAEMHGGCAHAFGEVIARIHQLQANEEKGGEG